MGHNRLLKMDINPTKIGGLAH